MIMSDLISRQVLDLWNRYKPTIAVDAIEYDRELKKLLGTNLASLGTDAISRQQAIDAVMECYDNDELFEVYEWKLNELPTIQPKRGKWVYQIGMIKCDQCLRAIRRIDHDGLLNFCPNCGSRNEVTT
jgi:hypothetical protein